MVKLQVFSLPLLFHFLSRLSSDAYTSNDKGIDMRIAELNALDTCLNVKYVDLFCRCLSRTKVISNMMLPWIPSPERKALCLGEIGMTVNLSAKIRWSNRLTMNATVIGL